MNQDKAFHSYLIADLNQYSESNREKVESFIKNRDYTRISNADHQLVCRMEQGENDMFWKLAHEGLGIIVNSTIAGLIEFAENIGSKQFYFRGDTGRLEAFPLFGPLLISFMLLNADGAFAKHLTEDLDMIAAMDEQGQLWQFVSDSEGVKGQVLSNPTRPKSPKRPLPWVRLFCDFNASEPMIRAYGHFPELTEPVLEKIRMFEMRLCVRRLAQTTKQKYFFEPYTQDLETRIITHAKKCGYDRSLIFSRFSLGYLILGWDFIEQDQNFECNVGLLSSDSFTNYLMIMSDIVIENIDQYNRRWLYDDEEERD